VVFSSFSLFFQLENECVIHPNKKNNNKELTNKYTPCLSLSLSFVVSLLLLSGWTRKTKEKQKQKKNDTRKENSMKAQLGFFLSVLISVSICGESSSVSSGAYYSLLIHQIGHEKLSVLHNSIEDAVFLFFVLCL
jgi:uncharacterized Tic20 family protein